MVGKQITITRFKEHRSEPTEWGEVLRILEHRYVGSSPERGRMEKYSQVFIVKWGHHEICLTPTEIGYIK